MSDGVRGKEKVLIAVGLLVIAFVCLCVLAALAFLMLGLSLTMFTGGVAP